MQKYKRFYIFQGGFEVLKLQYFKHLFLLPFSEAYSAATQTSKMELYPESP